MARLNIDDEFFLDPRLIMLARRLTHQNDEVSLFEMYQAIGMCVKFWSIAQSYWRRGIEIVPAELVSEFGFVRLVEVGLAEQRDSGIYCKGASHHFKWLVDASEKASLAGRASARSRREKNGNAIPYNASNAKASKAVRTRKSSSDISSARTSEQPPPNSPNGITLALTPDITLDKNKESTLYANKILEIWNSNCGELPKASRLTVKRREKSKSRLEENPDPVFWETAIKELAASTFAKCSNWANFDWLIDNDTNAVKAFEGKYRDIQDKPKLQPAKSIFDSIPSNRDQLLAHGLISPDDPEWSAS